jgi:hypothetical protein
VPFEAPEGPAANMSDVGGVPGACCGRVKRRWAYQSPSLVDGAADGTSLGALSRDRVPSGGAGRLLTGGERERSDDGAELMVPKTLRHRARAPSDGTIATLCPTPERTSPLSFSAGSASRSRPRDGGCRAGRVFRVRSRAALTSAPRDGARCARQVINEPVRRPLGPPRSERFASHRPPPADGTPDCHVPQMSRGRRVSAVRSPDLTRDERQRSAPPPRPPRSASVSDTPDAVRPGSGVGRCRARVRQIRCAGRSGALARDAEGRAIRRNPPSPGPVVEEWASADYDAYGYDALAGHRPGRRAYG